MPADIISSPLRAGGRVPHLGRFRIRRSVSADSAPDEPPLWWRMKPRQRSERNAAKLPGSAARAARAWSDR
eukprot:2308108-Prymnesium_polylepis.2